jgi:parvulin-like peptidyl-prolyl isomerase
MRKKYGIWILILAVIGGGIGLWKFQDQRVKALKLESEILRALSEEQVVMLLQNQQLVEPGKTYSVVQSTESRQAFLKGLHEYLALAAAARLEGLADEPNIKRVLEYKTDALLFGLYQNKLDNDQGSFFELPKERIESYLADPEKAARYEADTNAIKEIQRKVAAGTGNPLAAPSAGDGEAKTKNREAWAKAKIISGMAKNDPEFIDQPAVRLRLKIAEAGVLATNYLNKYWMDQIKPTEKEVTEYLSAHPEYDLKAKRELAQKILERAKAGEDFAALAKEFSEDRTTKNAGGLYENVQPGFLWNEVQQTVNALENGQLAPNLVETKDGWHIVRLVSKTIGKNEAGSEVPVFNVCHILLQKRFEERGVRKPDIPPPFLTPREIAEAAIRTQKRQAFVDRIIAAQKISLPGDFAYEITDELKNSGIKLENKLDEIEKEIKTNPKTKIAK